MGRLLTVDEVSRALHVHPNTIRRWSVTGYLNSVRVGPRRDRRFKEEDITVLLTQFGVSTIDGPLFLPRRVKLNRRQRSVLGLLRKRKTSGQIAEELGTSIAIVESVIGALRHKFQVDSRDELATLGREQMEYMISGQQGEGR